MSPEPTRTDQSGDIDVPLSNNLSAPGQARAGTRVALDGWRLPALTDDLCLAVSELVTNAVTHGYPPVTLLLRRRGHGVRIDVHDENPAEPGLPPRPAHPGASSGRGLAIVAALADTVGCVQVPDHGKTVYAEFHEQQPSSPPQPDSTRVRRPDQALRGEHDGSELTAETVVPSISTRAY